MERIAFHITITKKENNMTGLFIETILPAVILTVGVGVVLALILNEGRRQEIIPAVVVFGFIAVCGMAAIAVWIGVA
jgi:hypothetical protein